MDKINKVTVLGTGVLGSQIAFQTAYSGFEVSVYDIDEAAIAKARQRFDALVERYEQEVPGADGPKLHTALARIGFFTDLGAAVADTDLVIEAIAELKRRGLVFVGIDVIGGKWLTEINVTSPTGIVAIDRFNGTDTGARIWDAIERRHASM